MDTLELLTWKNKKTKSTLLLYPIIVDSLVMISCAFAKSKQRISLNIELMIQNQNIFSTTFLVLSLLFTLNLHTFAQVRPNLGSTSRTMNQALEAMEAKDYAKANEFFRQIIESNTPIPSEMPYYFAETLFELKQYSNSSSFLAKYLDLNGLKGEHYDKAKALEKKLEEPLAEIKACNYCDSKGYRMTECTTCHGDKEIKQNCSLCKAQGVVGCSRCAGKGVVTKKNVFNILEYYDCERCEATGRTTCSKCEGSKVEMGECRTCDGKGHITSEELCNHQTSGSVANIRTPFKNIFNSVSHSSGY